MVIRNGLVHVTEPPDSIEARAEVRATLLSELNLPAETKLIGTVANMRPDLYAGLIAGVPFVDVLNTMLDASLPLTPPEWPEWGNPIASREEFAIIRSYSPYDNVTAKAYPHIFAYAGLTDPRVTYWEPAKWIARLRHRNTSDRLILLKTNMEAGHGGASGRFEALKELAVDYAFALKIAGEAATGPATGHSTSPSGCATTNRPATTPPDDAPRDCPCQKSSAARSDTSPAKSSAPSARTTPTSPLDDL